MPPTVVCPSSKGRPGAPTRSSTLSSTPKGTTFRTPRSKPTSVGKFINTDISAHPRTDPINALNVLLRLFSALPTRIGGCQFKLTSAEHTLSLHLLSIIEPYAYQGVRTLSTATRSPSKAVVSGLVHQPTEILDAIMSHIDSRRDLLSVGVCCKRLHDIVFPRHFDYRVIRCKPSSISVWNHLLVHRSLARNVRRVEILDERTPVGGGSGSAARSNLAGNASALVPRGIMQRDTDLESTDDELGMHHKQERYMASALLRMTGLKEFKWSCNHSPTSIENLWPTLMMRCSSLQTLEISDNLIFTAAKQAADDGQDGSDSDSGDEGGSSSKEALPVVLPAMMNVVFSSTRHSYGSSKNPELSRIAGILKHCPHLKTLVVSYAPPRSQNSGNVFHPRADEFFLGGRWADLTSLTLSNVRCITPSIASGFLAAHPNLESLDLQVIGLHALDLPDDSLPRLKEISASKEIISSILECPCPDALRPLEAVKGFKLSGTHSAAPLGPAGAQRHPDQTFLAHLRRHSGSLKRVELTGWHDMDDLRKMAASAPSITYLDVGKRLGVSAHRERGGAGVGPVTNLEEWLEVLETLPELRTLQGVKFFYEVSALNALSCATTFSALPPNSLSVSSLYSSHGSPVPGDVSSKAPTAMLQLPSQMSLMDRSRMKKNDGTASMMAWRCPKLRRVDHWEDGKVIILTRASAGGGSEAGGDGGGEGSARETAKVRWEVRRLRGV